MSKKNNLRNFAIALRMHYDNESYLGQALLRTASNDLFSYLDDMSALNAFEAIESCDNAIPCILKGKKRNMLEKAITRIKAAQ